MKKIGAFILGFFSALLSALATAWVFLSMQKSTTTINGKIKAKKGASATINTRVEKKLNRKLKRKFKKQKNGMD